MVGAIVYGARYTPINGGGLPIPSNLSEVDEYFSPNHVGHTVAMTDVSGLVVSSEVFDAFGSTEFVGGTPGENNRRAFTKERSELLRLDNHGFRYYSSELGRYISRDPIGYADGMNVYLHSTNNPVNYFDPQGLLVGFALDALSVVYDTYQYATDQISATEYGIAMSITAASLAADATTLGFGGLAVRGVGSVGRVATNTSRVKSVVKVGLGGIGSAFGSVQRGLGNLAARGKRPLGFKSGTVARSTTGEAGSIAARKGGTLPEKTELIDEKSFSRWEKHLNRRGVKVTRPADWELDGYGPGIEGLYKPGNKVKAPEILLRNKTSKSAFWEEVIHAKQDLAVLPDDIVRNGKTIDRWEMEAKCTLIRNRLGIPNSQTRDTVQQLRNVYEGTC